MSGRLHPSSSLLRRLLCCHGLMKGSTDEQLLAYASFALAMLRGTAPDRSFVLSPASLGAVLSLLMEGSAGESAAEIGRFLSQGYSPHASIGDFYRRLAARLAAKSKRGVLTRSSNTLIVDQKHELKSGYSKRVHKKYGASIVNVDVTKGEQSAKAVNDLISKQTGGLITNLLLADSFTPDTALLLVNTITFEGAWAEPFEAANSYTHCFHGLAGDREERYMSNDFIRNDIAYSRNDERDVIEMFYKDPAWSLFLLVPKGDYSVWLSALTPEKLVEATKGVVRGTLLLRLPKFKLENDLSLKEFLEKNGVSSVFGPAADLTAMTKSAGGFFVDTVVQRAVLNVDEEGTTAGVATCETEAVGEDEPIVIDRPFMFLLCREQIPVFLGHFV